MDLLRLRMKLSERLVIAAARMFMERYGIRVQDENLGDLTIPLKKLWAAPQEIFVSNLTAHIVRLPYDEPSQ